MLIKYGNSEHTIDITEICNNQLRRENLVYIPASDHMRSSYFTDPLPNVLKSVFIVHDDMSVTEYDHTKTMYISTKLNKVLDISTDEFDNLSPDEKVFVIHTTFKLYNGSFIHEYPEQRMAVTYLTGNEKVLEIGANIGRNSMVISYMLSRKNNTDLVVLETDTDIIPSLLQNKLMNHLSFQIENSALSNRNLIQKGWDTIVSDTVLEGYKKVNTIRFDELIKKYSIQFDTLVLDCEGAFYYILQDMPEILENINLIIMENDYHNLSHKEYVDSVLLSKNYYVDYREPGGWGPCQPCFYEVWKKTV